MHGGVIPFRGTGADALRYVEADRARADDYYLGAEATVAQFAALDGSGAVTARVSLAPAAYAEWVDWVNPLTGEQMGKPRRAGVGSEVLTPVHGDGHQHPEVVVDRRRLLHPEVSDALDAAEQDALAEIRRWLAPALGDSCGVAGSRRRSILHPSRMHIMGITHRTSRAGDPHRHIHMQIGTRVWAAGEYGRGLFTAALFHSRARSEHWERR